jgi:twinkle protein
MSEEIQRHLNPCDNPECGSSDAVTQYFTKDGVLLRTRCHKCGMLKFANQIDQEETMEAQEQKEQQQNNVVPMFEPVVGQYEDLPERGGISKETCKKYGIQLRRDSNGHPLEYIFNYYDTDGKLVAQKFRDYHDKERMTIRGKVRDAGLFGQQAFSDGGKYVTIVVGEFDAPAAYQMMGSKWPVVSIKNGDQSALKELRKESVWKWLDSFDYIVLAFDADESGQKAVQDIVQSKVFKFNKLKLMKLRNKDSNEYLKLKQTSEFLSDFWQASSYIPKNILKASDLKSLALTPQTFKPLPYMWDGLNDLLHGIFTPSLITVTAGSGVGKSTVVKTLMHHVIKHTASEHNIGALMLEEPTRDTLRGLMTIELDKNLNLEEIPDGGVTATEEEKERAWEQLFKGDRLYLYGDFGSNLIDQIVTDVTYMAQGLSCKYIFLDHISIIVAGQDNGDERKALDEVTVKLRELCHTLDIAIILVCHTKRVIGKPHEEGGQTSLSDLRGTAGIGQMSDVVLGLERNGQHDNPFIRDCTVVRVLKNRRFGRTGPAAYLKYDYLKGTLSEIDEETYQIELERERGQKDMDTPVFDETDMGSFT